MNISVERFKSILSIEQFYIDGFTLLAGANSSGKSSLLQALLLFKQTLESTTDEILSIRGPYVYARNFQELVHEKSAKGCTIRLNFKKSELEDVNARDFLLDKYMTIPVDDASVLEMAVTFKSLENSILVSDFELTIKRDKVKRFVLFHWNRVSRNYEMATDIESIYSSLKVGNSKTRQVRISDCKVEFMNFFPVFVSTDDSTVSNQTITLLIVKDFRTLLSAYLKKIYYIGPNRVSPELDRSYQPGTQIDRIESNGANTRLVLAENKNMDVNGEPLGALVNFWIKKMELAQQIKSEKNTETKQYTTLVNVNGKLNVDLCNTGFGNSQILPILVQGLIMPSGSILIVEDPEVHMHPAVQAAMTDFFIDLVVNQHKTIIIETHSDHIVTRIRRRVSENPSLIKDLNICYVSNTDGCSDYISLTLNGQADFNDYPMLPKGFMDTQDEDFREILKNKLQRR